MVGAERGSSAGLDELGERSKSCCGGAMPAQLRQRNSKCKGPEAGMKTSKVNVTGVGTRQGNRVDENR